MTYTIYEIAQHVMTEKSDIQKEKPLQIGYQESRAYKILEQATTLEIILSAIWLPQKQIIDDFHTNIW